MLSTVASDLIGSTAVQAWLPADVSDIQNRLVHGDATLGWRGDPTMFITFALPIDPLTQRPLEGGKGVFEVWAVDGRGEPYMVLAAERCDQRIVRRIAEAARPGRDPVQDVIDHNVKIEAERKRQFSERVEEYGDKLHHALMRDVGHHYGGLTRRIHSFASGEPKV
jgi:hypothetical protein